jgi:CDP-diacylglycerol---serine O-phosphatidyltransferase
MFLLPNLLTTLNLFCGFYSVIAALDRDFVTAATAIIVAAIFDALDGKIARLTHTTSRFGVEYDSLADLVSFGMAPALLMVMWCLQPLGRIGWLGAFLFMACGAFRLARFNVQAGSVSGDHFCGLPIPGGAGMVAATVLFCHHVKLVDSIHPIVFLVMIQVLAVLMVSTIKYHSFKRIESFRAMTAQFSVVALLVLVFVAFQPAIALFLFGAVYVVSGPLIAIRKRSRISSPENEIALEESESVKPSL